MNKLTSSTPGEDAPPSESPDASSGSGRLDVPDISAQRRDFRSTLAERIVLCDGAMGTMIYAQGVYINQSYDNLNLVRPHLIKNIHNQYLNAGAEVLETNTFGATRGRLAAFGLADKVREINLSGARLAIEASEGKAWVAGAIGPLAQPIAPHGELSVAEAHEQYREQITALLEGEVDLLMFESFDQIEMLVAGIEAARRLAPEIPIIAQVRFGMNIETRFGNSPREAAQILARLPVDVIGTNCGAGAEEVLQVVEQMRDACDRPISAQPNIGFPRNVEDRMLYLATPEYLMEFTRRMIQKGARLIGACCGSTPEHIRSIRSSIRMIQPGAARDAVEAIPSVIASETAVAPSDSSRKELRPLGARTSSRLAGRLRRGEFVVSIEIDPPLGTELGRTLEAARICRDAGVDCINIADGPRASARMGPVDMALILNREIGDIEPLVHFCCRDRNILGLQADLIGACALGLRNVLVITGDPPKMGNYPFATAVYDVDAIGALRIGSRLNSGHDLAGAPLRGPATELFLGCGANPGAIDLDIEIARLEEKIEAGAEYILTQPVYDIGRFEVFLSRIAYIRVPILLGILPLASFKNAEFLNREVPGMEVPKAILERMKRCEGKDTARREGIAIAREALGQCHPHVAGTYIMPPFNRVESALEVLEALPESLRPRPRRTGNG